jgi:peptidyl-prolyl cis-trans isomerase SurA
MAFNHKNLSMKNHLRLLCAAFIAASLTSCTVSNNNNAKIDETPIISIGKNIITIDEFRYVYEKNNSQDSVAYSEASLRQYIDLFVNYKLKVLEAQSLGLDTTADFKAELSHYKEQLAKPYLTDSEVSNKLIKESYQRLGEEIRASHILIRVPQVTSPDDTLAAYNKLNDIRKKAIAGENFETLAKKYSEDPSVVQNGGDIGYFTALQMVYQFEDVAYKTKLNEVSPVFRTKFGYHILKVTNKRKSSGPIKVAHILVRATEGISQEDSISAANKIQEIYKQAKAGEEWNKLAEKYSDDIDTRSKGGELKWFSPGNMYPSFDEAAFALQNKEDITEPIKTIYGWHLIKLLDKKPLESFEALEPVLKRKIAKDSRLEINKTYLINKLKVENNFVQQKGAIKLLNTKADSTMFKEGWQYDRNDKDLTKPLFTINKQKYTLRDFYSYLETLPPATEKIQPAYYLQQQFQNYTNQTVYEYQNEHLAEKVPEYRYLMNEYRDGTLMFKVMEQNVWTKALTDTAGLNKFFAENQQKYQWKERAVATIYYCDSEATRNQLKEELQKDFFENTLVKIPSTDFNFNQIVLEDAQKTALRKLIEYLQRETNELVEIQGYALKNEKAEVANLRMQSVKAYLISEGIFANRIAEKNLGKLTTVKKGGISYAVYTNSNKILLSKLTQKNPLAVNFAEGTFEKGTDALLDLTTWQVGKFEVNTTNRFGYIAISKIIPAGNKKLTDTKGVAVTDYQNYLENSWIENLRKKYPIQVNEQAVKKILQK